VDLPTWWKIGGALSVVYIVVFLGLGGAWWKVLGLW
jgi:DASS family divalent anion:Na+ symporter